MLILQVLPLKINGEACNCCTLHINNETLKKDMKNWENCIILSKNMSKIFIHPPLVQSYLQKSIGKV